MSKSIQRLVAVHTCNPALRNAEAGGYQAQGPLGPFSNFPRLSENKNTLKKNRGV